MGILGELNQIAKAGSMEKLLTYLTTQNCLFYKNTGSFSSIDLNDPRTAGAYRRSMHHNAEISIASYR